MRVVRISCRLAVMVCGVAAAGAPLAAQSDADVKAVEAFRLTTSVLDRMAQVQENMYATVKAHPELAKKYAEAEDDDEEDAKTLDDMARRLDRVPEFKAALIKAGFTPRGYMVATMAIFQAAMTAAVLDMPGADRSKVPANTMANVAFLKAHAAQMQRLQARAKEIDRLSKQQSGESDESAKSEPDTSDSGR